MHAAFERAVGDIAKVTKRLLDQLPERGEPRTREKEGERAKARWSKRDAGTRGRTVSVK